eukprot:IDg15138t1
MVTRTRMMRSAASAAALLVLVCVLRVNDALTCHGVKRYHLNVAITGGALLITATHTANFSLSDKLRTLDPTVQSLAAPDFVPVFNRLYASNGPRIQYGIRNIPSNGVRYRSTVTLDASFNRTWVTVIAVLPTVPARFVTLQRILLCNERVGHFTNYNSHTTLVRKGVPRHAAYSTTSLSEIYGSRKPCPEYATNSILYEIRPYTTKESISFWKVLAIVSVFVALVIARTVYVLACSFVSDRHAKRDADVMHSPARGASLSYGSIETA